MLQWCKRHIFGRHLDFQESDHDARRSPSFFLHLGHSSSIISSQICWAKNVHRTQTVTNNVQFDCKQYFFQQNINIFSTKNDPQNA